MMPRVNGTKWAELPSDGIPHRIDDGPVIAEGPCSCIDCRCEKQVQAIMALEAEMLPVSSNSRRRTR